MNTTATPTRDRTWQVFYGEANPALARVYLRVALPADATSAAWQGWVTGPRSVYGHTLPARYPLRRVPQRHDAPEDHATLLAEAIVPDPCLWTPAEPYLYDVHVELRATDRGGETFRQAVGIRPLGCAGARLRLAAKNYVLRAGAPAKPLAGTEGADASWRTDKRSNTTLRNELAVWHRTETALWTDEPSDALCTAASEVGVLLVADLRAGDRTALANTVRRLARFPAVGVVVWPADVLWESACRHWGPNVFFARQVTAADVKQLPEADLFLCDVADWRVAPQQARAALATQKRPCVALQRVAAGDAAEPLRAACDALQRQLAAEEDAAFGGPWAGYWVNSARTPS